MTLRYRCTNKETPHTFNGYDEDLMRQLPRVYATEFPAILTECSEISTKLAKLMRPLFQSGVGPHQLSKVLQVMHTERFDNPQLQYYEKMKKYSGYIPCSNFLSHAYSSYTEEFVPFMDQSNAMLDDVVLKGDHSFKIIKRTSKTNGTSVFSSLNTVMNEYKEIRMQVLAHTRSLKELLGSSESMMDSYRSYGFEMPKVFYTDNVMADKNTLE
ncbi:hypothetical protein A0J61_11297, partial [Choanephora cucurbitarum]